MGNYQKPVETSENHRETGVETNGNGGNEGKACAFLYNIFEIPVK